MGLGHFLYIVSPFVLWPILTVLTRHNTKTANRRIGIALSVLMIIILVLRNIEIFVLRDFQFNYEVVPLQVCHLANFI